MMKTISPFNFSFFFYSLRIPNALSELEEIFESGQRFVLKENLN